MAFGTNFAFLFSVEPLPERQDFYEIQAGWAEAWITKGLDRDASEAFCRQTLRNEGWLVQQLLDERSLEDAQIRSLPDDFLQCFEARGYRILLFSYETGGGPESPGLTPWTGDLF